MSKSRTMNIKALSEKLEKLRETEDNRVKTKVKVETTKLKNETVKLKNETKKVKEENKKLKNETKKFKTKSTKLENETVKLKNETKRLKSEFNKIKKNSLDAVEIQPVVRSQPTTRPVSRAQVKVKTHSQPGSRSVSRNASHDVILDRYKYSNSEKYIYSKTRNYIPIDHEHFGIIQIGDNIRYIRVDGGFRLGGTVVEINFSKKYQDTYFRLQYTGNYGTIMYNIFWSRIRTLWRQKNIENEILKKSINMKQNYINHIVEFLHKKFGNEFKQFMISRMQNKQ